MNWAVRCTQFDYATVLEERVRTVVTWITQAAFHHNDVIMGAMASQITCLVVVYSTVYSGADQRKHQSSASLCFVWGIRRWPVNSPHKRPVTRKMFPFDDVIIYCASASPWKWNLNTMKNKFAVFVIQLFFNFNFNFNVKTQWILRSFIQHVLTSCRWNLKVFGFAWAPIALEFERRFKMLC